MLTYACGKLWDRLEGWPWRESIRRGLAPVSIGLMLAVTITIAKLAIDDPRTVAMAGAVTAVLLCRSVSPAWLIVGCAVLGAALLGR